MTPAQLNVYVRAYMGRRKEEQRITQVNLYSLASLIRPMIWAKSPPSFDAVFPAERKPEQPQTDDQMYATVRALNALFGGDEEVS